MSEATSEFGPVFTGTPSPLPTAPGAGPSKASDAGSPAGASAPAPEFGPVYTGTPGPLPTAPAQAVAQKASDAGSPAEAPAAPAEFGPVYTGTPGPLPTAPGTAPASAAPATAGEFGPVYTGTPGPLPTAPGAAPASAAPAAPKGPAPKPGPRAPKPGSLAARLAAKPKAPTKAALPTPKDIREAEQFGRVDEDGTVYVKEQAGDRKVGQFPGVDVHEALSLYVRRFLDLKGKVQLLESRLETLTPGVIEREIASLKAALTEPAAVGDLDGLRGTLDGLKARGEELRAKLAAERKEAKAKAVAARTAIVEKAEAIVEQDPNKVQWRNTTEQMRGLMDEWKAAQRSGPRIDRPTEDELWKRFSHARARFERRRRQFFTELDKKHGTAKATKERLVQEAERIQNSTNWGETSRAYRDLMDQWREAGRSGRKDDDALWARFQAARDVFFGARTAYHEEQDKALKANLDEKIKVIEEAEKLVPIKNIGKAKEQMRKLQDQFDEIGYVPRANMDEVERRMGAVADAIKKAEDKEWQRSNPETKARTQGALAQLEAAVATLKDQLAKAESKGDSKQVANLKEALAARQSWLEQVKTTASDFK